MKKVVLSKKVWALFLAVTCSALLTAGGDTVQGSHDSRFRIAGTYYGEVYNGDNMDPVITTFSVNSAGKITGKYAMGEEAGLERGKLSDFRFEGDYTVVAAWHDKYGTGVLRMLFASDAKTFSGYWGKSASETMLPWHGTKR